MNTPENPQPTYLDLDPQRWRALPVIVAAAFLSVLDFFIVNVSVPSIQNGLHASFADLEFIIAGYALGYAVALIPGGRLGDIYGRKRVFIWGMAGFTFASLLCGLAATPLMLIAARVFQGLMAAVMVPQGLSILQLSFPPDERPKAFAVYGVSLGLASIAGFTLGGLLVEYNVAGLAWRSIFLVNLPVGIAAVWGARKLLTESKAANARSLDLLGVLLISVALFLLCFPLVEGRELGWPSWAFLMLLFAWPMLLLFVAFERRVARRQGSPLLDLNLFSERAFVIGLFIVLVFFSTLAAFFFVTIIYLQIGLGFRPLVAGLSYLPFAVGFLLASLGSATLVHRFGRRVLQAGCLCMILGLFSTMSVVRSQGDFLSAWILSPCFLVYGFGQGLVLAPLFHFVLSRIRSAHAGNASGVMSTVQQLASALGVSIMGVIFFGLKKAYAAQALAALKPLALSPAQLAQRASALNYRMALVPSLLYNVVMLAICFFLIEKLPRGHRQAVADLGLPPEL